MALFIYGGTLRCFSWAFFSYGEWGLLLVVVHSPLTAVASLAGEHRLGGVQTPHTRGSQAQQCGPRSCGAWADLLHGMWNLSRPGIKLRPLHRQVDLYPLCHQGSPRAEFKPKKSRVSLYPQSRTGISSTFLCQRKAFLELFLLGEEKIQTQPPYICLQLRSPASKQDLPRPLLCHPQ